MSVTITESLRKNSEKFFGIFFFVLGEIFFFSEKSFEKSLKLAKPSL